MVSTTQNRISYTGNGATTTFAFPFYFQNPADLIVLLIDTVTKTVTHLILNTDYSVSGTFTPPSGYKTGGAVNIPGGSINVPAIVPATQQITIIRAPSLVQNLSLPANSSYPPQSTEAEFDSLVLMLQRASDLLSRAVVLKDGTLGVFDPTLPIDITDPLNVGCVVVVDPAGSNTFKMGPNVTDIANATASAIAAAASAAAALASENVAVAAAVQSTQSAADAAAFAEQVGSITEVDTSGGDVVETLPLASGGKQFLTYINTDFGGPNNVNVGVIGPDTLQGGVSDVLAAGEVGKYWSNGVDKWYKMN